LVLFSCSFDFKLFKLLDNDNPERDKEFREIEFLDFDNNNFE